MFGLTRFTECYSWNVCSFTQQIGCQHLPLVASREQKKNKSFRIYQFLQTTAKLLLTVNSSITYRLHF